MKEHLLLEKAYIYPLPKLEPSLEGCKFDDLNGYWITGRQEIPYIYDKSACNPPSSKKCDVETGEDQKGE